jgi:hypothetical protein
MFETYNITELDSKRLEAYLVGNQNNLLQYQFQNISEKS